MATWRFNDDFRVACLTYAETLDAIERLDRSARAVGLALNESKTVTFRFFTYLIETLGLEVSELGETIDPQEVEDVVGDYTDDFLEDPEAALATLVRTGEDAAPEDRIVLRDAGPAQVRLLRRAIASLAKAERPEGVKYVEALTRFMPSLTPTLMRYLRAIGEDEETKPEVASVLDSIIATVKLNDWQRIWIVSALMELALLERDAPGDPDARVAWVRGCDRAHLSLPLQAEAWFALAASGRIATDEAVDRFFASPQSLSMTYAAAVRSAAALRGEAPKGQLRAFGKTSPVLAALVG